MTAEECAFFVEGLCAPPEELGFTCPWAITKSGLVYCNGNNSVLLTEKDWEAKQIKRLFAGKDWEAEHFKRYKRK